MKRTILLLLITIALPIRAEEPVNYVNLGATLIKDGYIQRAKQVLEKADVKQRDFDFLTYYTLKGVLYHKLGYPLISNIFFEKAISLGQSSESVHMYMARNYWQRQEYEKVIAEFELAGETAKNNEQTYVIKAEAFKQLGDMKHAWAVLDEGLERFPKYNRFYSQKFYYLLQLGLYQHAMNYADQLLEVGNYSENDYLAVAFALRENNNLKEAASILEAGVIRHPSNEKLLELLGQVYIDQQQYMMAALVFDWASISFPKFAQKAATLYLKAGDPVRSLQLNRRIIDQKEKFKQRLGIDIELEDYESLVAKTDSLKRYDLLSEESVVYALGFANFKIGNYEESKTYLKQIKDEQLYRKASYLFNQIEKCQNDTFECI